MALKVYFEGTYLCYGVNKCKQTSARINWNQDDTKFSIETNTGSIIEDQPLSETVDKLDVVYTDKATFESAIDDFFVNASGDGGTLVNIQVITSNGTYTPTAGAKTALARVTGGGGSGGGVPSGLNKAAGGGGGGGGTAEALFNIDIDTTPTGTATIGAGGAGTTPNGNSGYGSSLVYGTVTISGGGGSGGGYAQSTGWAWGSGGAPGSGSITGATGTVMRGERGTISTVTSTNNVCVSGRGGASYYGQESFERSDSGIGDNPNSSSYGEGGAGAVQTNNTSYNGGGGADGIIVIYEYS